ncbi:hypothetical protein PsAD13_03198 [Pseudovibrio sp. Ad13]|uniref:hypothetical protein n=1 Tax=Pseudovibrio sp. Ad13 TaxID=989396 RepID=UPI0007AE9C43|nr:hypothetical protein [Pseudovibrio sp. Ad13]KZK82996.1 hypothetical protein PsAD13_03198 [Pseudovibrio sp. Ad13]
MSNEDNFDIWGFLKGAALLTIAGMFAWDYFTTAEKDPVISAGEDAIELHLIRHANWPAVSCLKKPVDEINFVFCYPAGASGDYGPLFAVENQGGEPVVYAINGKAIPILEYVTIEKDNGTPVQLALWTGKAIDIAGVLAEF